MAEGILRARAAEAGVDLTVSSAGVMQGGAPATPDAVGVLAELGIDISNHVSQRLDRDLVAGADLVLAMTRDHLREAVLCSPPSFPKIFTLRELVRRLEEMPGADLANLNVGRSTADYHGSKPDDDVKDPIGQPRKIYAATAAELDALLTTLAKSLESL